MNTETVGFSLKNSSITFIVSLILLIFGSKGPYSLRCDAAHSPHGFVKDYARAYSPNFKYVAKLEFDKNEDRECYRVRNLWSREIISEFHSAGKGFAWSADSKLIAAMWHGGAAVCRVLIFDVQTGEVLTSIDLDQYYHYMAFRRGSSRKLLMALSPNGYPVGFQEVVFELEGD